MEPRFEVQTAVSKGLMRKLVNFDCMRPKYRLVRVSFIALAIFYFYQVSALFDRELLIWLFSEGFSELMAEDSGNLLMVFIAILLSVYLIIRSVFMVPINTARSWRKSRNKEGEIITHVFSDVHYAASSKNVSSVMQYEEICALEENKDIFFLKRTGATGVAIAKSDFTTGSPEDFRAFIEEKTGKKIKFIR